jgi:(5-formylfuran-3-yl)methyl phosphate synthase
MRLLVSVRSEAEALLAAEGGADFIDLKEPREGALGGLPVMRIRAIVQMLRGQGIALPISATIGDLPMHERERIAAGVDAVAGCGVDYVKVGIERAPQAAAVLDRLAASGHAIVPVFIADRGLDTALIAHACRLNFPGVMADTADKLRGSLFDCVALAELQGFVRSVRQAGKLAGLAGALRASHLPVLRQLAPDFAGFRSAVCVDHRASALDAQRLRALACEVRSGPSMRQAERALGVRTRESRSA